MILDKETLFSDDQNLTSTGASTNVIDLGAPGTPPYSNQIVRDIGKGVPIPITIQLTADASGTSPTIQVDLEESDSEGSGYSAVASSATLSGGVAGDTLSIEWIPTGTDKRYIRLNYTLGGTSPDYTITAGIVGGHQQEY